MPWCGSASGNHEREDNRKGQQICKTYLLILLLRWVFSGEIQPEIFFQNTSWVWVLRGMHLYCCLKVSPGFLFTERSLSNGTHCTSQCSNNKTMLCNLSFMWLEIWKQDKQNKTYERKGGLGIRYFSIKFVFVVWFWFLKIQGGLQQQQQQQQLGTLGCHKNRRSRSTICGLKLTEVKFISLSTFHPMQ